MEIAESKEETLSMTRVSGRTNGLMRAASTLNRAVIDPRDCLLLPDHRLPWLLSPGQTTRTAWVRRL